MTKKALRKKYKALREGLSTSEIEDLSLAISNQVLKLPVWSLSFYHVFLSITENNEVNTDYLLSILSGKDKHVIVSKSDLKTRTMSHFLLSDSTKIQKNSWNIPEPSNGIPIETSMIEVVFVPLLTFDNNGHRVGYGKGFYDTFLSNCSSDTIKIGLSFFENISEIEDIHEADVALNYCVTPHGIHEF
jgi:5-formyltetrahydrofolate cyclo-ligase